MTFDAGFPDFKYYRCTNGVTMVESQRDVKIGCHTTLLFTPLSRSDDG